MSLVTAMVMATAMAMEDVGRGGAVRRLVVVKNG